MNQPISTINDHGFTLIEMSIVLVIIGIILASVMKGRDLIYSAKATKAEKTFFQPWQTILDSYYRTTGYPLGDGEKNGGHPGTKPDSFGDYLFFDEKANRTRIKTALNAAGIDPCTLITTNVYGDESTPKCPNGMNVFAYKVDSEHAGHREVTIGLGPLGFLHTKKPGIDPNPIKTTGRKNVLIFFDLPLDYAKRIDTRIDGIARGEEGKALFLSYANGDTGISKSHMGVYDTYTTPFLKTALSQHFYIVDQYHPRIYARPWPSPEDILKPANQNLDPKPLKRYFSMCIILDY